MALQNPWLQSIFHFATGQDTSRHPEECNAVDSKLRPPLHFPANSTNIQDTPPFRYMQYRGLLKEIPATVYELQTSFQQFQGVYSPFLYPYYINIT